MIIFIGVQVGAPWLAGRCVIELETKVREDFIVSYSRPSLMIIALASQFHVYLQWCKRPFSIVS